MTPSSQELEPPANPVRFSADLADHRVVLGLVDHLDPAVADLFVEGLSGRRLHLGLSFGFVFNNYIKP
jgi:hypothetical protein